MTNNEFIEGLLNLGIKYTDKQLEQLEDYYNLLVEWNNKINLTSIIEKEDVYLKHFYDSLTIVKGIDLNNINTLCDVGTGAGFPGLVIKIMFPHIKVILIDSKNKKLLFIQDVINKLNLENVEVIHTRAEEYNNKFDLVTSRAVARIDKLVNYTMHLLNNNGVFIAMKGNIDEELTDPIKKEINKKYKIENIIKFKLEKENSDRSLVIIKNT